MAAKLLMDTFPVTLTLEESTDGSGRLIVRGEFAKCDIATSNGRVYPYALWEREIKKLSKGMKERRVYGELDHPGNGRTELARASHIITSLSIENGIVIGEAEVLDTDRGRNVKAIFGSGCRVGISSRGFGSTKKNSKGEEVVQEDYHLATFDFVADPADDEAYPEPFYESSEEEVDDMAKVDLKALTKEQLEQTNPDLVKSIVSEAVGKVEKELEDKLAKKWADKIEQDLGKEGKGLAKEMADLEKKYEALKKEMADLESKNKAEADEKEKIELKKRIDQLEKKLKEQEKKESAPEPSSDDNEKVKGLEAEVNKLKREMATLEKEMEADCVEQMEAALEKERAKVLDTVEKKLREEFEAIVLSKVASEREAIFAEAKEELLNDPNVAGAQSTLSKIKTLLAPYILPEDTGKLVEEAESNVLSLREELSKKDLRILDLEDAVVKMESALREMGLNAVLEQVLSDDPDAELIRRVIGDVNEFESIQELKDKITSVKEEFEKRRKEERSSKLKEMKQKELEVKEREKMERRISEEISSYEERLAKMEEALESAVEGKREMALALYIERKLTNHPKAAKIRKVIEAASPSSKEEIDEIFQQFRERSKTSEELEEVRARVRRETRGGIGSTPEVEEEPSPKLRSESVMSDYNGLGVPLDELKRLCPKD